MLKVEAEDLRALGLPDGADLQKLNASANPL
jgi:hypothetical protein